MERNDVGSFLFFFSHLCDKADKNTNKQDVIADENCVLLIFGIRRFRSQVVVVPFPWFFLSFTQALFIYDGYLFKLMKVK